MGKFYHKAITDPVHGTISLSNLESDIASSKAFQRLHNVRQLGFAHLVFPGANYSRFSHSIGACHNASQMIEAVSRNAKKAISEADIQAVRLAALLHDIGHYPFSHATEHVVSAYYAEKNLLTTKTEEAVDEAGQNEAGATAAILTGPPSYDHESLGAVILSHDAEIQEIANRHKFDLSLVSQIYSATTLNAYIPIISSDLDCDRLDYLRRTAHFSGAPYGSVDITFLIDQATLDKDGRFCFGAKALRAADHLLVSRYYDYMQVPFHKTVVGLEWSLVAAIRACFDRGLIKCSAVDIESMVKGGTWQEFDDQFVVAKFRALANEIKEAKTPEEESLRDHLNGIINRKPPKMVAAWEDFSKISDVDGFTVKVKLVEAKVASISAKRGIDPSRLHVWSTKKNLSSVDGTKGLSSFDEGELAKALHVLNPRTDKAELLVAHKEALLHQLSGSQFTGVRVYYLPPGGVDDKATRAELCKELESELGVVSTAVS